MAGRGGPPRREMARAASAGGRYRDPLPVGSRRWDRSSPGGHGGGTGRHRPSRLSGAQGSRGPQAPAGFGRGRGRPDLRLPGERARFFALGPARLLRPRGLGGLRRRGGRGHRGTVGDGHRSDRRAGRDPRRRAPRELPPRPRGGGDPDVRAGRSDLSERGVGADDRLDPGCRAARGNGVVARFRADGGSSTTAPWRDGNRGPKPTSSGLFWRAIWPPAFCRTRSRNERDREIARSSVPIVEDAVLEDQIIVRANDQSARPSCASWTPTATSSGLWESASTVPTSWAIWAASSSTPCCWPSGGARPLLPARDLPLVPRGRRHRRDLRDLLRLGGSGHRAGRAVRRHAHRLRSRVDLHSVGWPSGPAGRSAGVFAHRRSGAVRNGGDVCHPHGRRVGGGALGAHLSQTGPDLGLHRGHRRVLRSGDSGLSAAGRRLRLPAHAGMGAREHDRGGDSGHRLRPGLRMGDRDHDRTDTRRLGGRRPSPDAAARRRGARHLRPHHPGGQPRRSRGGRDRRQRFPLRAGVYYHDVGSSSGPATSSRTSRATIPTTASIPPSPPRSCETTCSKG